MEEQLDIKYMPLSVARQWDDNPKKHDIPGIIRSIQRYGFRDAPIWDKTLNKGKGGIVGGNGRITCLWEMKHNGDKVPRGIIEKDGEWFVPIQTGIDAPSETEAVAFAIDHNNLTVSGQFYAFDLARMWDERLLSKLQKMPKSKLPVSFNKDEVAILMQHFTFPHVEDPNSGQDMPHVAKVMLTIENLDALEAVVQSVRKIASENPDWKMSLHVSP